MLAVLAGASYPPIGSCVRARWAHAIKDSGSLHTAYSFEAVVDESIFMVGPILVTVLATQFAPVVGVAAIIAFAVVGGLAFASLRSTEPPTTVRSSSTEAIGWRFLVVIVLVSAALGSLFGSTEVVTVAFAKDEGHGGLVGVLLATWASGSLISGLITGLVSVRATPRVRFRWGTLGLALAMSPLPLIPNLWVLAVNLFVGGFAISPTLVATVSLIEAEVPAARLTEGMTWLSTGIAVGLAPGSGDRRADHRHPRALDGVLGTGRERPDRRRDRLVDGLAEWNRLGNGRDSGALTQVSASGRWTLGQAWLWGRSEAQCGKGKACASSSSWG